MNGGTFTPGVEKIRAGIYMNFKSAANERVATGERGTVALPIPLGWGPSHEFVEINGPEDISNKLGLTPQDASLYLLREAMKRSRTVLLYRLNDGEKASITIGEGEEQQKVTAKYSGVIGNRLSMRISTNVVDETMKDVVTFLGTTPVDRQTVGDFADLEANEYVEFEGIGTPIATAGANLTGGTDGEVTNEDVIESFEAAEQAYIDTFAFVFDEQENEQLKEAFVSFVKGMRDGQGVKFQGVMAEHAGDYEGIINVTNGVKLASGREVTAAEAVAWAAGASAGATLTQSLTFVEYEGAIDANPRFSNDEIIERIKKGEFLFTYDPREKSVGVEADINSLVSLSDEKNKRFQKNRFIRVIDAINNDIRREVRQAIKRLKDVGLDISTDDDGIQTIRTLCTIYMNTLQDRKAIVNFDSQEDIQITRTGSGDGFNINVGAQPNESAEKFYFGMEVR